MISIIQAPAKYTSAGNNVIFQFQSDNSNISYFKVELFEATSNDLIANANIYTTPATPLGSYINLSRFLDSLVKWGANNSVSVISVPISKSMVAYTLKLTEILIDGSQGTQLTLPNTYYAWNADIDDVRFRSYTTTKYVITDGLVANFLTNKPDNALVNDFSSEQLYFIHNNETSLSVQFKTYDQTGNLLNIYNHPIDNLSTNKLFRLQVSPKTIKEVFLIDFTNISYYTVQLVDNSGVEKTHKRTYGYRQLPCGLEPVNLLFVNELGGIDSYQFINPQETINYTRTTIKRNPFKVIDGIYTDMNGDILNGCDEVINVQKSGSYIATSRIVTDAEGYWLRELYGSTQVFVELNDESLVPVMVTNNSYNIQRQKWNKEAFNTTQIAFTLSDGIIPNDSIGYGAANGAIEIEFIDSQMNGL